MGLRAEKDVVEWLRRSPRRRDMENNVNQAIQQRIDANL